MCAMCRVSRAVCFHLVILSLDKERAMSIDILIAGGRVVDGTGNPWRYGDVAIQGDRIADITPPGQISSEQAREVVDAGGMVVCPGFIDIQSHSIQPLMRDG